MISRIRNGLIRETSDVATTKKATNSRLPQYGRNSATMRRIGT